MDDSDIYIYIYMNELYIAGMSEYIWVVTVLHNEFYKLNVTLTEVNNSTTDIHVEKYSEQLGYNTCCFVSKCYHTWNNLNHS